jgi:hypothetical protein
MSYYGKIKSPLGEALALITGTMPPNLEGIYHSSQLDDEKGLALSEWCEAYRPTIFTGDGTLEAAELLVQRALENDNIDGYEETKHLYEPTSN